MANCHGCEKPISPRRKWCGEGCRKRHSYCGTCVDCGARTGYSGVGTKPSEHCGDCASLASSVWTRGAIVGAIQLWAERHGQQPAAIDWNTTLARKVGRPERGHEFPNTSTVLYAFGTWNAAMAAAGFTPVRAGHYRDDSLRSAVQLKRAA